MENHRLLYEGGGELRTIGRMAEGGAGAQQVGSLKWLHWRWLELPFGCFMLAA